MNISLQPEHNTLNWLLDNTFFRYFECEETRVDVQNVGKSLKIVFQKKNEKKQRKRLLVDSNAIAD